MVRLRTAAVNAVRGLTKACGHRMPASSTRCFAERSLATMPPGLARALAPVLEQIAQMTLKIKHYDRQILELTQTEYPETQAGSAISAWQQKLSAASPSAGSLSIEWRAFSWPTKSRSPWRGER
jgi:transposase